MGVLIRSSRVSNEKGRRGSLGEGTVMLQQPGERRMLKLRQLMLYHLIWWQQDSRSGVSTDSKITVIPFISGEYIWKIEGTLHRLMLLAKNLTARHFIPQIQDVLNRQRMDFHSRASFQLKPPDLTTLTAPKLYGLAGLAGILTSMCSPWCTSGEEHVLCFQMMSLHTELYL